jgi:hypothetical protein
MNIFATSPCPRESAQALDNARLSKMLVETAQILSTVLHHQGVVSQDLYKPTHQHHPCTLWAGANIVNFSWLMSHGLHLYKEYKYRYGAKNHKSGEFLLKLTFYCMQNSVPIVRDPQPLDFANSSLLKEEPDTHEAYRLTMIEKWSNDKRKPSWGMRGAPEWSGTRFL